MLLCYYHALEICQSNHRFPIAYTFPQYYLESHAVIFIVDSSDRERVEESRDAFGEFLSLWLTHKPFPLNQWHNISVSMLHIYLVQTSKLKKKKKKNKVEKVAKCPFARYHWKKNILLLGWEQVMAWASIYCNIYIQICSPRINHRFQQLIFFTAAILLPHLCSRYECSKENSLIGLFASNMFQLCFFFPVLMRMFDIWKF